MVAKRLTARIRPIGKLRTALAALLGVAVILGVVLAIRFVERLPGPTIAVPAGILDVEMRDEMYGYMTLGDGRIVRFTLAPDDPQITTVAKGLLYPRGLAITQQALYVTELGQLPCERPFPVCKAAQAGSTEIEGEESLIRHAAGRLLEFPLREDGSLGAPRVILDRLPYVDTDHGVNDVEVGPGGDLYVAIGNIAALWREPTIAEELRDDGELLGTVLRVRPTDGTYTIFAQGLRNVYGLTFDDTGRLFSVDNDGETVGGWRQDELLELKQGLDYGYPFEGTFGPFKRRTDWAMWSLPVAGAAGVAAVPGGGGLYVGSCGRLDFVPFEEDGLGLHVEWRNAVHLIAMIDGCVTAVVPTKDGVWAAILAGDRSRLERFRMPTD